MKLTITINMDNDAFADSWEDEAARILDQVANRLRIGVQGYVLLDINGTAGGTIKLSHVLLDINSTAVGTIKLSGKAVAV